MPDAATARPWFVHDFTGASEEGRARSGDVTISCDHPATITVAVMDRALTATLEEARANVALIVRAVNCHEELVAALNNAAAVIEAIIRSRPETDSAPTNIALDVVAKAARAALLRATTGG